MSPSPSLENLQEICKQIRRYIIEMTGAAGSGHPGGSLSAVEILVTLFFGGVMRHDPRNPKWPERDRFILSKGHACPVLYSVFAEAGYTPKDQLKTLRKLGSIYQGHPDVRFIPALDIMLHDIKVAARVARDYFVVRRGTRRYAEHPGGEAGALERVQHGIEASGLLWVAGTGEVLSKQRIGEESGHINGALPSRPGDRYCAPLHW